MGLQLADGDDGDDGDKSGPEVFAASGYGACTMCMLELGILCLSAASWLMISLENLRSVAHEDSTYLRHARWGLPTCTHDDGDNEDLVGARSIAAAEFCVSVKVPEHD